MTINRVASDVRGMLPHEHSFEVKWSELERQLKISLANDPEAGANFNRGVWLRMDRVKSSLMTAYKFLGMMESDARKREREIASALELEVAKARS